MHCLQHGFEQHMEHGYSSMCARRRAVNSSLGGASSSSDSGVLRGQTGVDRKAATEVGWYRYMRRTDELIQLLQPTRPG